MAGAKRGRANSAPGRPPRSSDPEASPWPDDRKAIHRRIAVDKDASTTYFLQGVARQLDADREHMAMLKEAVVGIYQAQRKEMSDQTALSQRLDRIELRADQDRLAHAKRLSELASGVPEEIDKRIALDSVKRDGKDLEVRKFLEKLELKDRPAEGATLVETFKLLYADLSDLKSKLGQYERVTDDRISAAQGPRAPAVGGLSPVQDETLRKMFEDVELLKRNANECNRDLLATSAGASITTRPRS